MRRSRQEALGWLVGASVPFWLVAAWPVLAVPQLWLMGLVETGALALTVVYAAVEHRSARRLSRIRPADRGVFVHFHGPVHDGAHSGLWYGLAAVAAVPWLAWAIDRPLPAPVVWRLVALALAITGALGALSWVARGRRSD
jgi:hypothetical protein